MKILKIFFHHCTPHDGIILNKPIPEIRTLSANSQLTIAPLIASLNFPFFDEILLEHYLLKGFLDKHKRLIGCLS